MEVEEVEVEEVEVEVVEVEVVEVEVVVEAEVHALKKYIFIKNKI